MAVNKPEMAQGVNKLIMRKNLRQKKKHAIKTFCDQLYRKANESAKLTTQKHMWRIVWLVHMISKSSLTGYWHPHEGRRRVPKWRMNCIWILQLRKIPDLEDLVTPKLGEHYYFTLNWMIMVFVVPIQQVAFMANHHSNSELKPVRTPVFCWKTL